MTNQVELISPAAWIVRFAPLIRAEGQVLDLACGSGRHARLLAGLGHQVEAVDRNTEALAQLAGVANITTHCADLEGGPWPYYGRGFDAIVVSRYLWRPLFPQIFGCLDEGGVLIYETFMEGQQLYGKPENPAYLLRPGELLELVRNRYTVIAFEQGEVAGDERERPQVIQRLCARRGRAQRLP